MCAHAVSVRLGRIEGVESVTLSLNEGRAALQLAEENGVTLEQVHTTVRQAGFTPRTARVTARADLRIEDDRSVLHVTGIGESFVATTSEPRVRDALKQYAGAVVIFEGSIDPPEDGAPARVSIATIEPAPEAGRGSSEHGIRDQE